MHDNHFTLGQVARLFGRKPHHVTYAITGGHVPEPAIRIGNKQVFVEDDLQRLARHFNVTYAITGGHVPEPAIRIGNKRVFVEDDLQRLARHFNIPTPQISHPDTEMERRKDSIHRPEGLSLAGPFTVEQTGGGGHEVGDARGEVFCRAADRPRALILAGLLEHACR